MTLKIPVPVLLAAWWLTICAGIGLILAWLPSHPVLTVVVNMLLWLVVSVAVMNKIFDLKD